MQRTFSGLAWGFVALVVGCGTDSKESGAQTQRQFAECCTEASQCKTGVCSTKHLACSVACTEDSDCPPEPKSGEPKCDDGVCEAEREGDDCEHAGDGGSTGSGGVGTGGVGTAGASSGGAATGGATAGSGGAAASGGSGAGGKSGGVIGIGDPCRDDAECESGICYRPGGSPGFCTASCSVSFDTACFGVAESGDNSAGELVYCMPFAGGGRCYPGCINSKTVCSQYNTVCAEVEDIQGYNGSVCVERL